MSLARDDPGSEPLDRILNGPLDTEVFLRLALALTQALREVHERGLVPEHDPVGIRQDYLGGARHVSTQSRSVPLRAK